MSRISVAWESHLLLAKFPVGASSEGLGLGQGIHRSAGDSETVLLSDPGTEFTPRPGSTYPGFRLLLFLFYVFMFKDLFIFT